MKIDKALLDKARTHIDKALIEVGKELGISLKTGNCRYSSDNFTFKLEGSLIGDDGIAVTKEAGAFKLLAHSYGLKAEHLHREFKQGGDTYKIVGLNHKARKFPIQAQRISDGATYKFPVDTVRFAMMRDGQEVSA
jgi:hypothetical protein